MFISSGPLLCYWKLNISSGGPQIVFYLNLEHKKQFKPYLDTAFWENEEIHLLWVDDIHLIKLMIFKGGHQWFDADAVFWDRWFYYLNFNFQGRDLASGPRGPQPGSYYLLQFWRSRRYEYLSLFMHFLQKLKWQWFSHKTIVFQFGA